MPLQPRKIRVANMAQSGAGLEITHVGLVVGTGSKHKMLRSLPATLPTGVIPKPGQVDQRHRFEDQIQRGVNLFELS